MGEIQSWEVPNLVSIATTVVTEQRIAGESIDVPSWAKSLLAVKGEIVNVTPTAAEPVVVSLDLRTCPKLAPFTVLFHPRNSIIGGVGDQSGSKPETFPINCPVNGGEKIDAYAQVLNSSTGVIKAMIALLFSSLPPPRPQYHSSIGTLTSTTTAVGEAKGTAYTIANIKKIYELFGIAVQTTATIVEPLMGYFRYLSSGFPVVPCKLLANQIDSILATTGQPIASISRDKVAYDTKNICVVQDYFNLQLARTVAGKWITGILYEQLSD